MSLFRKRGPSAEDVTRENAIKRNITKELSSAIRTLQREHHKNTEVILSADKANSVCNVLEAIFLHGLKDSVTKKIANYMNLNQHEPAFGEQSVNFWQFVSKFTHSDVTAQLKRLGQITTEIGLCRSWIRMALNDCLMESYVDSMLADKKTLEYFYHRLAYLRDLEQPEIFKSYLKGLMSFEFKLSYNSSLLNNWTNSPLLLSGIKQPDNTPLPVIQQSKADQGSVVVDEKYTDVDNGQDFVDVKPVRTRSRGSSFENENSVKSSKKVSRSKKYKNPPSTPPNTPYDTDQISAELTRSDVEEIRKLGRSSSPHGTSECSSSSHISCPDPGHYNCNPSALIDTKIKEENVFHLCDEHDLQSDVGTNDSLKYSPRFSDIESRNLESYSSPQNASPEPYVEPQGELLNENILNEILDNTDPDNSEITPSDYFISSGLPSAASTSNIPETDTATSSDKNTVIEENCDKSEKTEELKNRKYKGKKHRLKPELSLPNKDGSPPEVTTTSAVSIETTRIKKPKNKGRLSMPNISSVSDSVPTRSLGTIEAHSESDLIAAAESSGGVSFNRIDQDDSLVNSPSVGNSLGARSGWSSSFDLEAKDTVDALPTYIPDTQRDALQTGRPKAESFGSLLQNYTPSSSCVTSPSMEDVLQDLPESSIISPTSQQLISDEERTVADEYEIVSAYSFPYSLEKLDRNTESKLAQFGELATEKGLDAQNYQCSGCKRPVGLIYGKPRVCSFDGLYYCFECHENDEFYIPASIIHNWDFRKHKVSKQNLRFLQDIEDQAVMNVMDVNPKLYEHVPEMREVQVFRNQLVYLKTYLFTCKQSIAEELRKSVWPKEYMYDNIHMYSLGDLLQVPSGQMQISLKKVIKFATKHVYECRLCSQKGFICELCNNPQVIYPFEIEVTVRCPRCKSVFHKSCKTEAVKCPKCQRREMRRSVQGSEPQTPDSNDYAYSPHR